MTLFKYIYGVLLLLQTLQLKAQKAPLAANPNQSKSAEKHEGASANTSISTAPNATIKEERNIVSTATQTKPATLATNNSIKKTQRVMAWAVRNFNLEFPRASDVTWTPTGDYLKATFVLDDEKMEAFYNLAGEQIGTNRAITIHELPLKARKDLAKYYNGYTIKEVIEFSTKDKVDYFISVENEQESLVLTLNNINGLTRYKSDQITKEKRDTASTRLLTSTTKEAIKEEQITISAPIQLKDDLTAKVKADTVSTSTSTSIAAEKKEQMAASTAIKPTDVNTKAKVDTAIVPPAKFKPPTTGPNISTVEAKPAETEVDRLLDEALTATLNGNYQAARIVYYQVLFSRASKQQKDFAKKKIADIDLQLKKDVSKITNVPVVERKVAPTEPIAKRSEPIEEPMPTDPVARKETSLQPKSSQPVVRQAVGQEALNSKGSDGGPTSTAMDDYRTTRSFDNSEGENISLDKEFSRIFISQRPTLNIADSSNDVKVTCQGIAFNGKNTFVKFLVHNESTRPFNLGRLELLYLPNYGQAKKISPRYIYSTPAILPGKESPLVYVAEAPKSIHADGVFVFEMEDQAKQTKITVNVSGADFLQKK